MSYRLVIAEKPSVGAAYAKVLGATNRQDGYWEGTVMKTQTGRDSFSESRPVFSLKMHNGRDSMELLL